MKLPLLLLFSLVTANMAQAQTPVGETVSPFGDRGEISFENTYHPPRVFVPNAEVSVSSEEGIITGVLTAYNSEKSIVADLGYRLELMSLPAQTGEEVIQEDSVILYDTEVFPENLTLLPEETRLVPFTYEPPSLPGGTYRLRIMITSLRGRDLGWYDAEIEIPESATASIVELVPGPFLIPEFEGTVLEPLSGPNVSPNTSFQLQAEASSTRAITVTPVLDIYEFDQARPKVEQVVGRSVTLQANSPARFTLPITAADQPEVYYGVLWLRNARGQQVSSLAPYRWVVRGADADVLWTRIDRMGSQAGDKVVVGIDFVGAADAETEIQATLTVSLLDDQGVLSTFTEENLTLRDSIRRGTFTFPLSRALQGTPRVKAVIAADGKEYFSREIPYNLTPEQIEEVATSARTADRNIKIGAVLITAGVIAFVYSVWWSRKRRR